MITSTNKKYIMIVLLPIVVLAIALYGYKNKQHTTATYKPIATTNIELPRLLAPQSEQVIAHEGYTVSYNSQWCIPNWVAYELTADEVYGEVPRGDDFVPDPLAKGNTATTNDYKRSGYDRGHMVPAGDMKWSKTAMDESFYLSNICPQNKNLNKGDWKELEELARKWAVEYGNIYIACGPIVLNNYKTIGENNVVVPESFFKVFLRDTGNRWTCIGFLFENKAGNKKLNTYIRSIDEIEKLTGIDFFPLVPDDVEEKIESQTNVYEWKI